MLCLKIIELKIELFGCLQGTKENLEKSVSLPHSCDGLKILICYNLLPSDRV